MRQSQQSCLLFLSAEMFKKPLWQTVWTQICSRSTLFASILNLLVMLGNYLQQTTLADDIFRCIFFLGALRVKLLTEHHLELLSLKGGCRGSSKSTLVKMTHCWKTHATAQLSNCASKTLLHLSSAVSPLVKIQRWSYIWATAGDFQQFDILTSVDSDEPVQPPFKLRNSIWCSVSSLTIIEYSSD